MCEQAVFCRFGTELLSARLSDLCFVLLSVDKLSELLFKDPQLYENHYILLNMLEINQG